MRRFALLLSCLAAAAALATPAGAATPACKADVSRAVMPPWARGGFSDPRPRLPPHVLGRSRRIVAILFGYPLRSPEAPGRSNKILWVERTASGSPAAFWIRAQRMDGERAVGVPVRRILHGGPGPSIVDLPEPGCWRLTLTWSGKTDTLDLAYGTGP